MIVAVDASVAVKWFVNEPGHELAISLLEGGVDFVAPDLIFAETANVLWKKLRSGQVTTQQAESACTALPGFIAESVPAATLLSAAFDLAAKLDHSIYDCLYLSCAERFAAKLITADIRFRAKIDSLGLGHLVASLDDAEAVRVLSQHSPYDRTHD